MINIGFIGAGNMGYAIMKGICAGAQNGQQPLADVRLFAFDPDSEKLSRLSELGVTLCESEREIFEKSKYVFLAVKPQQLEEVMDKVTDCADNETVIVSICAGITAEYLKSKTFPDAKVVLVMPNTPLLLGKGATALAKAEPCSDEEFSLVCSIFASCGKIAVVSQDKMKEIIAINGSSPAFIYLYAQAFIDYADSVGIDAQAAKELFAQSLIGAAAMMTDSGYSMDELIRMVSSKGGTTIAGLDKLRENGLEKAVTDCCKACTERAYQLSK